MGGGPPPTTQLGLRPDEPFIGASSGLPGASSLDAESLQLFVAVPGGQSPNVEELLSILLTDFGEIVGFVMTTEAGASPSPVATLDTLVVS